MLINLFRRYLVVRKLKKLNLNNLINRYISINDIERIKKLNKLSHSTFKKLAELQQVKNYDAMSKEDRIYIY